VRRRISRREHDELEDSIGTAGQSVTKVLREIAATGDVIEEFRPLWRSVEWESAQTYWQSSGSHAFLGDHVPFTITNDGNLSAKAADLFFASVDAADRAGTLESRINVLEIGAGLGLFARWFLDSFRERCHAAHRNYYDRLHYVVADRSAQMLEDLRRHGTLAEHATRCEFRNADATQDGLGLIDGIHGHGTDLSPTRTFRAVFFNYLLDCLPATVLRFDDGEVAQLHLRTRIARGVELSQHTSLSLEDIRARAASDDPRRRGELAALHRLFALDVEYRPLDSEDDVPWVETARRCVDDSRVPGIVLHNFGAIECLERAFKLLAPGGFVLVNDYEDSPYDRATRSFRHQRFGGSAAFGLNLKLLEKHFVDRDDCTWLVAPGENSHLASRLLSRNPARETVRTFAKRFSAAAYDWHFKPIARAREHLKAGRHESALTAFTEALERQPRHWPLMTEIADFLTYTLKEYGSALRMTEDALRLNPHWPALWNTHGDCLYFLDRFDEAHAAFEHALALNPRDVRAHYNLSFTLAKRRDPGAALLQIAKALALDAGGNYHERLLEKQREIINDLAEIRRVSDRCAADRYHPANRRVTSAASTPAEDQHDT
jgi:tetratricopeptide (TPR) repeat protein